MLTTLLESCVKGSISSIFYLEQAKMSGRLVTADG